MRNYKRVKLTDLGYLHMQEAINIKAIADKLGLPQEFVFVCLKAHWVLYFVEDEDEVYICLLPPNSTIDEAKENFCRRHGINRFDPRQEGHLYCDKALPGDILFWFPGEKERNSRTNEARDCFIEQIDKEIRRLQGEIEVLKSIKRPFEVTR